MQRLGVGGERAPRGGRVRRLRVVDEPDAVPFGDELEPMRDTPERAQRLGDRVVGEPGRARGGGCGRGVLPVVGAGQGRLGREGLGGGELDASALARHLAEPARHDRGVLRDLVLEDPELRVAVLLEAAVAVEVVGLEVDQHGDVGPELVNVFELEARELADDPHIRRRLDAGDRPPDVARNRHLSPRRAEHRAEPLDGRRLSVRPGHAEDGIGQVVRCELHLAPDRNARSRHDRVRARHAGALDQDVGAIEERDVLVVTQLTVDAHDLDAVPLQ